MRGRPRLAAGAAAASVAVAAIAAAALAVTPTHQSAPAIWKPVGRPSVDVQLEPPLALTDLPQVIELDLFDTPESRVRSLRAKGTKVVCYLSAGSWENFRPDAGRFPASTRGRAYDGFPDERWLDIRRLDLIGPPLAARLDRCRDKGFHAADPDNIQGFEEPTGFGLTRSDQLRFNRWLAGHAHERGLAVVQKNATSLAPELVGSYDALLTESCFRDRFCDEGLPYRRRDKPHFDLEYLDEDMQRPDFCPAAAREGIVSVLKRSSAQLDGWRRACP